MRKRFAVVVTQVGRHTGARSLLFFKLAFFSVFVDLFSRYNHDFPEHGNSAVRNVGR